MTSDTRDLKNRWLRVVGYAAGTLVFVIVGALFYLWLAPTTNFSESLEEGARLEKQALKLDREGRHAEAEPLFKRSLAIKEKGLGYDHLDVAWSLSKLGRFYEDRGRYADAEPLLKRSLAIREKALGSDHPNVVMDNLAAAIYVKQGRYAEAEPLIKRSLAITEKASGADHP